MTPEDQYIWHRLSWGLPSRDICARSARLGTVRLAHISGAQDAKDASAFKRYQDEGRYDFTDETNDELIDIRGLPLDYPEESREVEWLPLYDLDGSA